MFIFLCEVEEVDAPPPPTHTSCTMVVELFYNGVDGLLAICDVCKGSYTLSEESEPANVTLYTILTCDAVNAVSLPRVKSSFT